MKLLRLDQMLVFRVHCLTEKNEVKMGSLQPGKNADSLSVAKINFTPQKVLVNLAKRLKKSASKESV